MQVGGEDPGRFVRRGAAQHAGCQVGRARRPLRRRLARRAWPLAEHGDPAPHGDGLAGERPQHAAANALHPGDQHAVRAGPGEPARRRRGDPVQHPAQLRRAGAEELGQMNARVDLDLARRHPECLDLLDQRRTDPVRPNGLQPGLGHQPRQQAGNARPLDVAGLPDLARLRRRRSRPDRTHQP